MKLDPDKAHRIEAAVRGLVIAGISVAIVFGASEAKATALGAAGAAIITLLSAVFVRSALAPRENPSQSDETDFQLDDPAYDEPVGTSE